MPSYHVVSLDSGPSYFSAGMLLKMREQLAEDGHHEDFLNHANVFAGTSAGGWLALFLAQYDEPDDALDFALDFLAGAVFVVQDQRGWQHVGRTLAAATGASSVYSSFPLRDYFVHVFGRDRRLGDLKHKVVVPAFQLDNGDPDYRSWKEKVFHNFVNEDPDNDELIVDVALRTSAAPIMLPVWQSVTRQGPGYVDGGFFAPSPSLIAIAQILNDFSDVGDALRENITMLSLGVVQLQYVAPAFFQGCANWGYSQWVLDPGSPLRVLDVSLSSGMGAIDYIGHRLLGKDRYFRLAPGLEGDFVARPPTREDFPELIERMLDNTAVRASVRRATEWLTSPASGWFSEAAEAEAATGAGTEAPGRATSGRTRRRTSRRARATAR